MVLVLHCFSLCDHCSLLHSRYFFGGGGGGKGSKLCFCTIILVLKNKVGQFIFTKHVFCTLFSLDELTYCILLVEVL